MASTVVLAGCSGSLVEVGSSPATIPDGPREAHGYVHGNTTQVPITYPVGMVGLSRDITVRTWVSGYTKETTGKDVAALVVYSSPNVRIEGQSVNPLSQLSNRELVRFVLERVTYLRDLGGVDDVAGLTEIGDREVTMLGTRTELVSYAGTAEIDGKRHAIVVNVAVVEHGDDVVVSLGIHDEKMNERAAHAALTERIVHEV